MCLAVPGRVVELQGRSGKVDFSGILREVQMDLVPETQTGDWVLVHAGFAIQRIDEAEALETLALLEQIEGELGGGA